VVKRVLAVAVAFAVMAPPPAEAMPGKASVIVAKRKRSRSRKDPNATTPHRAAERRAAARQAVAADLAAGEHERAANTLAQAARDLADPVLFIESAEACLAGAEEAMDPTLVDVGMERARIALDMLHFQRGSKTRWVVVETALIDSLVTRANAILQQGDDLGREIASLMTSAVKEADTEENRARGMVIAGSILTGLGVAGAAIGVTGLGLGAARQKDAEALDLDRPGAMDDLDELDQQGKRANIFAYVGGALALVGVTAGTVLIVLGKQKQRERAAPERASVRIAPTPTGVSLWGRF
jgi:hypothetical protein